MSTNNGTNDHGSRGHHSQGPSALKALWQCPGFENIPGTSAAAEMGTRIHEALEVRDPSNLLEEKEVDMYDACVAVEDKLIADFFGDENYTRLNELPVTVPLNAGREIWGTGDVLCVSASGTRALMIDYKTGRMKVDPARDNLQAKAYKNGAYNLYPNLEVLRFIFLAPQINWINWHDFEPESVPLDRQHITEIVTKAQRTAEKWADGSVQAEDLNPCDQCTWCRHQTYCPAINGILVELGTKGGGLAIPDTFDIDALHDPEQVAHLYSVAKVIEPLVDKIKKAAVAMAHEGEVLPGWELRSMGAAAGAEDNDAFCEYAAGFGVSREDILDLVNIPVAQVRDLIYARAEKGEKGSKAKEFMTGGLDSHAIKKHTERFTLRPEESDE